MTDDFPLRSAITRRFTLGVPRDIGISPDGGRVVFLRSRSGSDPVTCLWVLDVGSGRERLLADPATLGVDAEDLPPEERARRERSREQAGGIVGWAGDDRLETIVFTLSGSLWVLDVGTGSARALATPAGVIDPRPSPDGARVAYVVGGTLRVQELGSGADRAVAEPDGPDVTWGLAEFAAAEEMDRDRGFWWAPDGSAVLAQRTDESMVARWHIGDPADPAVEPAVVRYPAAGTANAVVTLHVLGLDGTRIGVPVEDEYLAEVTWDRQALIITTMPRDQRVLRFRRVDPRTGTTELLAEETDPAWVDVQPGLPRHLADGTLVRLGVSDDARRLVVGDRPVTPPNLQVMDLLSVDGDRVLMRASDDPTTSGLWTWRPGTVAEGPVARGTLERVGPTEAGVWSGRLRGGTLVVTGQTLASSTSSVTVTAGDGTPRELRSLAESPGIQPNVRLLRLGARRLATALLLPTDHVPGSRRLPVVLDPYGGPGHARVLSAGGAYLIPQWFADQGYAVIVADGRGTPGRGPGWERAVLRDLAGPVLEDQVDALLAVASEHPDDLDLARVAIRGWSFGGYLALLADPASPGRVPGRDRGRAGHGLALVRRVLHGALPGSPGQRCRCLRAELGPRGRGQASRLPDAHPRPRGRQRGARPRPSAVRRAAGRGSATRVRAPHGRHPHGWVGGRDREPVSARARLPAPRPGRLSAPPGA